MPSLQSRIDCSWLFQMAVKGTDWRLFHFKLGLLPRFESAMLSVGDLALQ